MKSEKLKRNAVGWWLAVLTFLALLSAGPAKADDGEGANGPHGRKLAAGELCLHMTNSVVLLTCSGAPCGTYCLEATTSLKHPVKWEKICTYAVASGENFQFVDTCASNYPVRFYRFVSYDKPDKDNGGSHGKKLGHDKHPDAGN